MARERNSEGVARVRRRLVRPNIIVMLLFGLIALGLIGGVTAIYRTIKAERIERVEIRRTTELMELLRDLNRAATNGETGQRGYFITLDKRYLSPYETARVQNGPLVERLNQQARRFPDARRRDLARHIAALAQARFGELDDTVAQIERGDLTAARLRILSDDGLQRMDELRTSISEFEALERATLDAAQTRSVRSEKRVVPLLIQLLLLILIALALALLLVLRSAEAEARAAHAAELGAARDRADLLARELNHRVKNLFTVVLAIVQMSERDMPESKPAIARVSERIRALLNAHDISMGAKIRGGQSDLRELVEAVVAPYCSADYVCDLEGPPVLLSEFKAVPFGLVMHELTTNAVKYGAWSEPGGNLSVRWALADGGRRVVLHWRERWSDPRCQVDKQAGFGSVLLEGATRQLRGTLKREIEADGIELLLEFPLVE